MGYSEMKKAWEVLYGIDKLVEVAKKFPTVFPLEGAPSDTACKCAGEPYAIIAIALDDPGIIALDAVPVAKIDEQLKHAFETINGRTFANGGDLSEAQWDAAVLAMSALEMEMNDADQMIGWAADDGSTLDPEVIRAAWGTLAGHGASSWADLEKNATVLYRFRRAQ